MVTFDTCGGIDASDVAAFHLIRVFASRDDPLAEEGKQ